MHPDFSSVLIPAERIAQRVTELGGQITEHFTRQGVDSIVVVGILNGAVVFLADLIRKLPLRTRLGMIAASSYQGAVTISKGVTITKALDLNIAGEHILLIDDILDTGRTQSKVQQMLLEQGAKSITSAVVLEKPVRRVENVKADFVGFQIPDQFVVGYGLDYNGLYRNVPDIGILKPELYR